MSTAGRAIAPFVFSFGLIAVIHCGGATSTPATASDAGNVDSSSDAQIPSTECHNPSPPPVGRPTAVACPATVFAHQDAGAVSCTALADCQDAGSDSFPGYYLACRGGQCAYDECLTDSDCPSGHACACAAQFNGNAPHVNRCIVSPCRVDTDCGPGGTCSPSFDIVCGSISGYYCRSAADTCTTDSSCCQGDANIAPGCRYAPELGHFTCQAITACGG